MRRRDFMTASVAAAATLSVPQSRTAAQFRNRIKQGAMMLNFNPAMPFDDMCRQAARIGFKGFDAVESKNWPILRKYELIPTLAFPSVTPPPFRDGIARKELHDHMEQLMHASIDECQAQGCPTIPVAGGQRRGMSYEEGADNCVAFFNRVKTHAEDKGVTLCIEVMNSKIDRPDQVCDHLAWAVQLCKRVNSPRVRVLFDIYHVQIMDGDICRNIRENIQWLAHFHTGGVPGRHEIDDTQELNYHFIAQTIANLGFAGYVTHEWTPAPGRDPLQSLAQAFTIIDA
jgi:hydroxypyruvate isomerase